MNVTCRDFRVALVWTRCHLDILRHPQAESKLRFLGRKLEYRAAFEQTVAGEPLHPDLETPWRIPPGEPFWSYYLEGARLPNVATKAWKAPIPFRRQLGAAVTAPWWPGRIVTHGFFYPQGVAVVAHATCREPMTLDAAADLVAKWGSETFSLDTGDGPRDVDLEALGDGLLSELSAIFLGDTAGGTHLPWPPFTVFTLVSGTTEDPVVAPKEGDLLHRALDGVVTLDPQWRNVTPPPLARSVLDLGRAHAGHLVYAGRRGRAVWFPHNFLATASKATTLSDYHRGLVLLSLQVESLCGFLADTIAERDDKGSLTTFHEDFACDVAKLIGRLYGNRKPFPPPPWYSSSVPHHVDANGYTASVDAVRTGICGTGPLHTPAAGG